MPAARQVEVHLLPCLVAPERLQGGVAVVIDVLRATTTILHALAAGCRSVLPVGDIDEARRLAADFSGKCLLGGERGGRPIDGFDVGNSPGEFTPEVCHDRVAILTTTNGTSAILHATCAERVLIGAFVNLTAIREELRGCEQPVHLLCAGSDGTPALEDTLFAGAVVDFLVGQGPVELNDSARLAWDAHEQHGQVLLSALELSGGGRSLARLGFQADLKAAASIDQWGLSPERCPRSGHVFPGRLHVSGRSRRRDADPWTTC